MKALAMFAAALAFTPVLAHAQEAPAPEAAPAPPEVMPAPPPETQPSPPPPPVEPPAPPPAVTGPGTRYFDGLPPARFVKGGFVTVLFVHPAQLYEACGAPQVQGLTLKGCARMMKSGVKAVIVPHPCVTLDGEYTVILCHELGHWAGWPGDHPL